MTIEEWAVTGLALALKTGQTVDDLCLFLRTADGLRQIFGITEIDFERMLKECKDDKNNSNLSCVDDKEGT